MAAAPTGASGERLRWAAGFGALVVAPEEPPEPHPASTARTASAASTSSRTGLRGFKGGKASATLGTLPLNMMEAPADAPDRLLTAWRGEIIAGAVYRLIARRLDEREADILRRMADAESGHRVRLEQRMYELGIPVPDPESVRVPLWLRLQGRIAPVDRLLAAREAAEEDEVDDLYKRSTGDPVTDRLLHDIRKEERAHSLAVRDMRSGPGSGADAVPGGGARGPSPSRPDSRA